MTTQDRRQTTRARRSDSGAVMLTVMLVMLALLGLGMTALWMTTGNLQIGTNTNMRSQALYVAEAGVEAVRNDMNVRQWTNATITTLLTGTNPTAGDDVPRGLDANGKPNGAGAIYVDRYNNALAGVQFPPAGVSTFSRTGTTSVMGLYTVWVRNDTAELRTMTAANCPAWNTPGCPIITDATPQNPTVVVRSMGIALPPNVAAPAAGAAPPPGSTQVILEVTMAPGTTPTGGPGTPATVNQQLCVTGKNSCDDNSSVISGVTAGP